MTVSEWSATSCQLFYYWYIILINIMMLYFSFGWDCPEWVPGSFPGGDSVWGHDGPHHWPGPHLCQQVPAVRTHWYVCYVPSPLLLLFCGSGIAPLHRSNAVAQSAFPLPIDMSCYCSEWIHENIYSEMWSVTYVPL